jgi:membrane protein YqaA with SNARE-associated domain
MLNVLLQNANRGRSFLSTFRHLGALGLFFLAILDSSPVPAFGGPDILLAILVSTRLDPWYEYAAVATVGSTIGAYVTFQLARKAGEAYLESKFGHARVSAFLAVFKKWGTGTLVASTALPFPFPFRVIAVLADLYGRQLVRIFRHPTQYWAWLLLFTAAVLVLIVAGIPINRRLLTAPAR